MNPNEQSPNPGSNPGQNTQPQIINPQVPQQTTGPVEPQLHPSPAPQVINPSPVQQASTGPVYAGTQPDQSNSPNTYQQPTSSNFNSENGGNSRKKLYLIAGIIAAVLLLGGTGFALLGGDEKNSSNQTPASSDSRPSESELDSKPKEAAVQDKPTEIAVNKSFQDDLGYGTEVTRIVRNYPATDEYARENLSEDGLELIIVEYKISNVSSKVNGASPTPLRLIIKSSDGKSNSQSYKVSKEELAAAGYTPLVTETPKPGQSHTGVVLYEVPKGDKKLSLYYRLKANIIGGEDVDKEYNLNLY